MGLPDSLLTLSVGGCICDLNTLCLSNTYQTLNFSPATVFVIVAVMLFTDDQGFTHWLTFMFCVLCLFRDAVCPVNGSYHLHLLAGYVFGRGREAHPSLDS